MLFYPVNYVLRLPDELIRILCSSGKLDKGAVLKALCAGFRETTEPAVCLSAGWCIGLPNFFSHFAAYVLATSPSVTYM
jgi:hypothetical protein